MAPTCPDQPPGPHRRRPGSLAHGDSSHGGDQRCLRGTDPRFRRRPARWRRERDGRDTLRARGNASTGWPAGAEADPPGHRTGGHERDLSPAQPGGRERSQPDATSGPATASIGPGRAGTAAGVDADRATRSGPDPKLPADTCADTGGGRGDRHPIREVPRPHPRADRRLRAVIYRLACRYGRPRPGSRECRSRHPGGSGPTRGPTSRARQRGPGGPHRLATSRKCEIAPRYRRAIVTRMNSISAAAPTVTRPVGRRPVTRLVSRTRDRPSRTSSGRMSVSVSVTDAPGTSRMDRGVAWQQGTPEARPVTMAPSSRSRTVEGRAHPRTTPGRTYQVPMRTDPAAPFGDSRYPEGHAPLPSQRCGRACRRTDRRGVRRECVRVVRPDRPLHGGRASGRRLPGSGDAHPERLPGRVAPDARFRSQLLVGQPWIPGLARSQRGPLRGRYVDIRRGAGRRPGRLSGGRS